MIRGIVRRVERTGEKRVDSEGRVWEKCIFSIELVEFSKRSRERSLPEHLRGKTVRVVRWCAYDWHYREGVYGTLTPEETERVLEGSFDLT